jgi:hypothetical protein
MKITTVKKRLAILSGIGALAVAGSVVQPSIANAATFSGKWSITAVISGTHNTAKYTTNSTHKVSTCVSVTSTKGTGGVWSYQLIWYDGGKNKVLWHSGDHEGTGRICSPVKKPGGNDKVYDHIIVEDGGNGVEVTDSGTYTFNTY